LGWWFHYQDINDHDKLRKDPVFAALVGMLKPVLRMDCEPVVGKSTLNRLEHMPRSTTRPTATATRS
jgi:hypothetical protein